MMELFLLARLGPNADVGESTSRSVEEETHYQTVEHRDVVGPP